MYHHCVSKSYVETLYSVEKDFSLTFFFLLFLFSVKSLFTAIICKEYIQTKAFTIGSRAMKLTECGKQKGLQKHEYLQI